MFLIAPNYNLLQMSLLVLFVISWQELLVLDHDILLGILLFDSICFWKILKQEL